MNTSTTKTLVAAGIISGVAYSALAYTLTLLDLSGLPHSITFISSLVLPILLGLLAGLLIKGRINKPYSVSMFALLFMYVTSYLVGFTQYLHVILLPVLLVVISVITFLLSNLYFNALKGSYTYKLIGAIIGLIVWYFACAFIGLYFTRLIVSDLMRS